MVLRLRRGGGRRDCLAVSPDLEFLDVPVDMDDLVESARGRVQEDTGNQVFVNSYAGLTKQLLTLKLFVVRIEEGTVLWVCGQWWDLP